MTEHELSPADQKVFTAVKHLGGSAGINELSLAYALPALPDIYDIVRQLVARGVFERIGGAIRIRSIVPPANANPHAGNAPPIDVAPPDAEVTIAKPKRKLPRPYFARLDPEKDLKKQIASRIVQYIASQGDERGRVDYMVMYHSIHGERYRNWDGHDLWKEALTFLGRAVRREGGFIWLDETRMVPELPSPYKPIPDFKPQKRKPRTAWFQEVASRAEANGLSISEQIEADRQGGT